MRALASRPRSSRGVGRAPLLCAVLVLTLLSAVGFAQTAVVLEVERADARLVITNRGLSSAGAKSILNSRNCEEGTVVSVFYGPPDRVEMVIDDETTLRSSLVVIREPVEAAGSEAKDQQTIEMIDGQATFTDRPICLDSFTMAEEPRVQLEQGRTSVLATRFFLDREADAADLDGPIELERAAEGESSALQATAESLTFDLETERSTLSGNVRVESDDRVSEADTLELDEEAGLATLTGNPARSKKQDDRIEGKTLLYYLDSNDVVVTGGVQGTLEVELD